MKGNFLYRWSAVGLGALFLGAGLARAQERDGENVVRLPQPTPGSLPDLRPPPGVEITRDAFENLMRKPFDDDWETPPWEKKAPPMARVPAGGSERVFQPEVVGEPDRVDLGPVPVAPEVIRVPDRVVGGVVLPPLRPPTEGTETVPELTGVVFETNPYSARSKAMEEGKFMLLAFVGTEWNGSSRQLSWEVFNSPDFLEYAAENLVPCYLDYPQKQNSGEGALMQFKRHFDIRGLPVVVLFDLDGTPYVKKSGYLPGSAEAYLAELKVLVEERKKVLAQRRRQLELDGFRDWRNLEGKVFFGKLEEVRDGQVWFTDPDGEGAKVELEKLSEEDRARALGSVVGVGG